MTSMLPTIWVSKFSSYDDYLIARDDLKRASSLFGMIDDRILVSRHSFDIDAWCVNCSSVQQMKITWHHCGTNEYGSINPAWTETCVCHKCGLNSRMRALLSFILEKLCLSKGASFYIAERVTPSYKAIKSYFTNVTGSEYICKEMVGGQKKMYENGHIFVRHEDLTALSFKSGSYDAVITQDVFEHIPNYHDAFVECKRVLKEDGYLVFTIPFFPDSKTTEIRAIIENGSVRHKLTPEYHGNPISSKGSLCFQHFGWDILWNLRESGFNNVEANLYWGPWQGHLGFPFFVFSAKA